MNSPLRSTGLSLIIGSLLMILTMVLHPVAGDFDHLLKVANVGIIAHSIGIFSIPFVAYGYWGVMVWLDEATFLSRIAFSFILFGLMAVMLAATLNGLVLTQFVQAYPDATEEIIDGLRPIFVYNKVFNLANDYIYMTAVAVSTVCWSIALLTIRKSVRWLGVFGLIVVGAAGALLLAGFLFTSVEGFRVFIFGTTAWTLTVGSHLWAKGT
ncbi:MAG: hypothetical protein AAGA85_04820 [Bacteroidota bacterium]